MENSLNKFDDFYHEIKRTIVSHYGNEDESIKKALNHLEKVIDYNVPFGKKLRGLCTYESSLILLNNQSSNMMETKAKALGWCIELVNIYPPSSS